MVSKRKHTRYTRKKRFQERLRRILILILIAAALILIISLVLGKETRKSSGSTSELVSGSSEETGEMNNSEGENGDSEPAAELELETQEDAPYEHWLAAAVVSGISMNYPDFESVIYYSDGTTELSESNDSRGIYVTFTSGGEQICVYASPLQEERTETGTVDIYSEVIGYATFDFVDETDIPAEYTEMTVENMNDLIAQSVRIMLYEH